VGECIIGCCGWTETQYAGKFDTVELQTLFTSLRVTRLFVRPNMRSFVQRNRRADSQSAAD
jgi:hypothetical protein